MACENERETQSLADQRTDVARIRIVRMNPVHGLPGLTQMRHQLIGKLLEMGPEQFLAQISPGSKGKAKDSGAGGNRLL